MGNLFFSFLLSWHWIRNVNFLYRTTVRSFLNWSGDHDDDNSVATYPHPHPHPRLDVHVLMQRGGVPAAVHILVHLLGDLLRMAEVGGGHSNPGVTVSFKLVSVASNPVAVKKNYYIIFSCG